MIRRLQAITGDVDGLRRLVVWFTLAGILQGIAFALLLPLLRALLADPPDLAATWSWLGVVALVGAVWAAVQYRATLAGYTVGIQLGRDVQHRIGARLRQLPLGWFDGSRTSWLARTVSTSSTDVMGVPAHILERLVTAVVTPAVVVAVAFAVDWRIATAFLVTVPVALLLFRWSGQVLTGALRRLDTAGSEAAARVVEFAQAQPALRASGRAHEGTSRLDAALAGHHQAQRALLTRMIAPMLTYMGAVQAGLVAVLLVGTRLALGGDVQVADVVALLVLAVRFAEPLSMLADLGSATRLAEQALDRVDEVLHAPTLPEPERSATVPADGTVTLSRVTFSYPGTRRPALERVDLHAPAGQVTALVGASGSGKTTVARLVARLWDADTGTVRVGGVDVRNLPHDVLLAQVAPVFQDAYLFDDTIAANVRLARPDATDADLEQVARAARLDEVLARLPGGWAATVGEGGLRLSGGERQRVALARALLKDAPVVLLDEATSALDPTNEALVQNALAALTARPDRTVLVIAHRLPTIARADRIIVLDHGQVAETGTHAELLHAGGRYARFWAERERAAGWRLAEAPTNA